MSEATSVPARSRSRATATESNPLLEARKKLEEAEGLRRRRKLDRAQRICEGVLKRYPDYVGALHTLGLVLADKHEYAQSLPYLVQAAMLNPKDWTTLTALSGVYLRLGARVMAARTLEQAVERKPGDANILATLGEIYRDNREYEAAAIAYRRVLSLDESPHAAAFGLGHCCTHLGELAEAAAAFKGVLKHYPHSINVLYSLSQLPPSLVRLDLLSLLEHARAEEAEDPEDFQSSYAFTEAAALDKIGRHAEAWDCLIAANRLPFLQHRDNNTKDVEFETLVNIPSRYLFWDRRGRGRPRWSVSSER
jgi:tetratricopeptide (TPR) repeat protein